MIPFPFNESQFSFFVADHLLVGQLCTNPKCDRSLLSCLKVTQCSTREIRDAPPYNSCFLPIQVMTTGPLPAPSKCKSGRFNAWGHSSTHRTTLWRWWSGSLRLRTSCHLTSSKSAWKSTPKCTWMCWRVCWSPGAIRWLVAAGLGASPQVLLDYFVWSFVENITNMTSHNTKASLIATIHWVFAELPPALVKKAYSQFRIRIKAVIEAEGGYIE